jgi:alpha-glucosidase (family GH31 glycosyl hydrolase)
VEFEVRTNDPFSRVIRVSLEDFRRRRFTLRAWVDPGKWITRIGMGFLTDREEGFFGFGERFNAVNQRGHKVPCWCEEGSFSAGVLGARTSVQRFPGGPTATYFPVPFFISSKGYGIEVDTPFRSTFDLARGRSDAYRFEVEWRRMNAVFYCGRDPMETFRMFVDRNGRTLVPPEWAFGPWNQMSGQIANKTVLEIADEYINLDIPTSCRQGYVHFFPEGKELGREQKLKDENDAFAARGLKSTCYFNPYVGKKHPTLFDEGKRKGYFVAKKNGDPYVFQYMNFKAAEVDFTNPAATAWYQAQLRRALDMGYDGCMYDFGEYTPVDAVFHDGREGFRVHNTYPLLYQKALFDLLQTVDPDPTDRYAPDFVHYVRSGYTGSQKYVWAHWTGDPTTDWSYGDGLPAQIPAGLSIGLSGIPFSGSDIGGFTWYMHPPPDKELLMRWTQLGCFSGIMRDQTGGFGLGRRTQIFDWPEAVFVWRKYAKLRTALFPYLYTLAHEAHVTGLPVMRHPILHFPKDPKAVAQTYQYLFGERFLVAPVVNPGQRHQDVYLPHGETWIDVNTAAAYDDVDGRWRIGWSDPVSGGRTVRVPAPETDCPLFVRAGSIIALLDPSVDTLNAATDPRVTTLAQREHLLHLWVWPDAAGEAYGYIWDGTQFRLSAAGGTQTLEVTGRPNCMCIAQIALGPGRRPSAVFGDGSGPLQEAPAWQDLIGIAPGASGWAWDATRSVLWIRLEPGDRKAQIQ